MTLFQRIKIPFLKEFRESMLSGKKTKTSRTKRYGKPGDTFEAFEAVFELTDVQKKALVTVAHLYYKEEGFENKEDFIACWEKLHPKKGYVPNLLVWLHSFRKVATLYYTKEFLSKRKKREAEK